MPRPKKFYLAGPFFNPPQIDLISKIELMFLDHDVPFFSPRQCSPENKKAGPLSGEDAKAIFQRNYENLLDCDGVLAVVDWLMPEGLKLGLINSEGSAGSLPISLPDSGTVWELGAAYTIKQETRLDYEILLLTTTKSSKLNVMLTQCADGVVYGLSSLGLYLNHGKFNSTALSLWKGGHQ